MHRLSHAAIALVVSVTAMVVGARTVAAVIMMA